MKAMIGSEEDVLKKMRSAFGLVSYGATTYLYKHIQGFDKPPKFSEIPVSILESLVKKGHLVYVNNGVYYLTESGIKLGDECKKKKRRKKK